MDVRCKQGNDPHEDQCICFGFEIVVLSNFEFYIYLYLHSIFYSIYKCKANKFGLCPIAVIWVTSKAPIHKKASKPKYIREAVVYQN